MTIKVLPCAKAEAHEGVMDAIDYLTKEVKEYGAEAIVFGVLHPNREASIGTYYGDHWLELVGLTELLKQKVLGE